MDDLKSRIVVALLDWRHIEDWQTCLDQRDAEAYADTIVNALNEEKK